MLADNGDKRLAASRIRLSIGTFALPEGVAALLFVGMTVFLASLFGILTRPVGFLAAFWPANAILLGLMVRFSSFATPWGWLGAFAGYLLADFATGGEVVVTIWLTVANMVGAGSGYLLYRAMPEVDRRLGRPQSVLYLLAICAAAAAAAAVAGAGAAQLIFDRGFLTGLEFWFVTELVNSLVILPVILTFPDPWGREGRKALSLKGLTFRQWAPAIALAVSLLAGIVVGGPGAIAFPVPALLWCALSYPMFVTAIVTSVFSACLLIAIPMGYINVGIPGDPLEWTSSIRLGVALMALGPLTAAAINTARADLVERLAYLADHCSLTGVLSRRAFLDYARGVMGLPDRRPVAVMMLDIDHFKSINDRFGHAAGDRVLAAFADVVADTVRSRDIVGRMGGEEFAILLSDVSRADAERVANRMVDAVEELRVEDENEPIAITVSIGAVHKSAADAQRFEDLLALADDALYRAKNAGRNRVVMA